MNQRIGADTDDFRLPVKTGLQRAAELGFGSVEIGTTAGDVHPRRLTGTGRRHLARIVRGFGLDLAALSSDSVQARRPDAITLDAHVDHARAVLEMAADVGAPVVTARLGPLIDPRCGKPVEQAVGMLEFLGEQADRFGTLLAVRVGDDDPIRLAALLHDLNCPSLRVCLDPAALLAAGCDLGEAVERLSGHLALSHARDARLIGGAGRIMETVLGRGDVDFSSYLASLASCEYAGPHIIRRTESLNPIAELREARDYLESSLR